ncbi:hypothetical protein NQ318_017456, partial [Aromia moschata]
KLTSAHIRQFVSPFYKQREIPEIEASKEVVEENVTQTIDETIGAISEHLTMEHITAEEQIFANSDQHTSAAEASPEASTSENVSKRSSKMSKTRKRANAQKSLARISIPTQNFLLRIMKEQTEPFRPKKSAYEYTKRTYICAHCRKRNVD